MADKVGDEKPGILADLPLAVFNLPAMIAAPVTGGASLVAAAGVNVAAAAVHVQEYLLASALPALPTTGRKLYPRRNRPCSGWRWRSWGWSPT